MKTIIVCAILLFLFGCAHAPIRVNPPLNLTPKVTKSKPTKLLPEKMISLRFPVRGGYISSPFGNRKGIFHRGLDIAAPVGTAVLACEDGKVIYAGRHKFLQGYGNTVLIKHREKIFTYYAHLSQIRVKKGDAAKRGQIIGSVGNTGKSRGPHLHLELLMNGKNHNPVPYFVLDGSVLSKVSEWITSVKKEITSSSVLKCLLGGQK